MKKTVFICEDQVMFLDMLQDYLYQNPHLAIVGTANNTNNLTATLATQKPDLLLTDLYLPGPDIFSVLSDVVQANPDLKILAMSGMLNEANSARLHAIGVHGIVSKMGQIKDIAKGIEAVLAGQIYYPETFLKHLKKNTNSDYLKISKREIEVMSLIAKGFSEKEIAVALSLSESTVNNHKRNIFTKLGVQNQVSMVVEGIRLGLIPNPVMPS